MNQQPQFVVTIIFIFLKFFGKQKIYFIKCDTTGIYGYILVFFREWSNQVFHIL